MYKCYYSSTHAGVIPSIVVYLLGCLVTFGQSCLNCFQEWLDQKKNKEKEQRLREQEKKKKELEDKMEKQKKADDKYKEWCDKAQKRPRSVQSSFGYTSGKLTGKQVVTQFIFM